MSRTADITITLYRRRLSDGSAVCDVYVAHPWMTGESVELNAMTERDAEALAEGIRHLIEKHTTQLARVREAVA